MKRFGFAVAFSLIASTAFVGDFLNDTGRTIVIRNDGGGDVDEFYNQANKYTRTGQRVEIRGSCRSACTFALIVPNVCVAPGAVVKWHLAYETISKVRRYDISANMLSELPPRIKEVIRLENLTADYNPRATLTYSQLIELGIPDCDSGVREARAVTYDPSRPSLAYAPPAAPQPKTEYVLSYPQATQPRPQANRRKVVATTNPVAELIRLPFLPFVAAARAIDKIGRK